MIRSLRPSIILVLLFILMSISSSSSNAQEDPAVLFSAVEGDTLYLTRDSGETKTILHEGAQSYLSMTWDPWVLYVIYTYFNENYDVELEIAVNWEGPGTTIAHDIAAGLPPSFTVPEPSHITYAVNTFEPASTDDPTLTNYDVYQVSRHDTSGVEKIGTIAYGVGCGGGGSSLIEVVYGKEIDAAIDLGIYRGFLQNTSFGVIHSGNCTATSTYITDLETGERTELGHNLQWVSVALHGTRIAGVMDGQIVVIDLNNNNTVIPLNTTAANTHRVIWSDDGSKLYYTGRTEIPPLDLSEDALQIPDERMLTRYNSQIFVYDFETDTETQIFDTDAYGIGSLYMTDANELLFSVVSNTDAWVQAVTNGEITDLNTGQDWITVDLYALNLQTKNVRLLAEDVQQPAVGKSAGFG